MQFNTANLVNRYNIFISKAADKAIESKVDTLVRTGSTTINDVADAWLDTAQGLLQQQRHNKRVKNTSKFPRYLSRRLLTSLEYDILPEKIFSSKSGQSAKARITIKRYFKAFRVKGFNYANYLDQAVGKTYAGYKQRIYSLLDKELSKFLKKRIK